MKNNSFFRRVVEFMYQRNGYDSLCRATYFLCIFLLMLNLFMRSEILSLITFLLMGYAIFRILSKNLSKRQKENRIFLSYCGKFKSFFLQLKNRFKDRNTHVYRKCPNCKNTLRLPKKCGNHSVNCPCCHTKFDIKI